MKNVSQNISLSILSGVLGFLAFPPFELHFLGWICLVPLLVVIRPDKPQNNFLYSFLSGAVFFGGLLYWLVNVTVPGTVVLVLVLALFYGLFGCFTGYVLKYSMDLFILSFVWVLLEFIRSNLFTGFPWGLLGYSQYKNINLIQVADFAGAYGVSFLVVIFNVAAFALITRAKRKIAYMMVALLFLTLATTYGVYKFNNYPLWGAARISVVQGNIPQKYKWDAASAEMIIDEYTDLTIEAAGEKPDMIVWPETSYPYLVEKTDNSAGEIGALASDLDVPILAGVVFTESDRYYNSAIFFDGKKGPGSIYHKVHLVPFGEYIPFNEHLSFLRDHIDKPIGDFVKGDEYTLFSMKALESSSTYGGSIVRQTNFYKFGTLICFEDIFPYITREFVKTGANFMVNITNDAWFGRTAAPKQHLQASVFRAVENRVPVVRAANTGISCFIDSTGKILSGVEEGGKEIFVRGVATEKIGIHAGRSYYTEYGDVFVYFCAFMMVVLLAAEGFFRRKEK